MYSRSSSASWSRCVGSNDGRGSYRSFMRLTLPFVSIFLAVLTLYRHSHRIRQTAVTGFRIHFANIAFVAREKVHARRFVCASWAYLAVDWHFKRHVLTSTPPPESAESAPSPARRAARLWLRKSCVAVLSHQNPPFIHKFFYAIFYLRQPFRFVHLMEAARFMLGAMERF